MDTSDPTPNGFFEQWRLLAGIAALLALACAALLTLSPDASGARMVIRFTARTSLVLFCLAFCASAMARLWPGPLTRWQRRNRRMLGLSFATSHLLHAGAIVLFAALDPGGFHQATNLVTYINGGIAYLFIIAMAATSFRQSAAWIGPRAWSILHTCGTYYLWISFLIAFGKRFMLGPVYPLAVALLVAALAIRLAAHLHVARAGQVQG